MKFIENQPIYLQIMNLLINKIISQELYRGEKLLSVREMAEKLMINPNTVQRALHELEQQGIVYSERGKGRFVTKDKEVLSKIKRKKIDEILLTYITEMNRLGYTDEEAVKQVYDYIEK